MDALFKRCKSSGDECLNTGDSSEFPSGGRVDQSGGCEFMFLEKYLQMGAVDNIEVLCFRESSVRELLRQKATELRRVAVEVRKVDDGDGFST